MSCELHSESGNSNNSGLLTTPNSRTTSLSRRFSSSNQLSGLLATSRSKDSRLNADYNFDADHGRITMQTRVAVRDKTPHRFQVVPLRDVSGLTPLDGGRPSQLTLPPASHTLLRSASIRRQTYSQVRPVIASSYPQLDITQNKCDMMLADSETLANPTAGIPVLALSPSIEIDNLERSHALAEQDMNRRDTKATTNKYEISITTTPTKAPQRYDESHHTHAQNPPMQLSKSPRKKRTRSENILRIRDNNRRDGPAATKDNPDFRMSKRHAIYTQSLYVPFLESPSYFPGSSTEDDQPFIENVSDSHLPDEAFFSEMPQAISSDSGATLSNTNSDDQIRHVLPLEKPLQLLMLKSLESATKNERYRGLNYHRLSRVYPLSAEARLHIYYPQIVRELFTDIDRAIQEWKQM